MSGTTPFVGVRVFSDLTKTVAAIDTRDSTVIGLSLPAPAADNAKFPMDEPVRISTNDVAAVAALGAGVAQDAITQIASEGIVTDIVFVRTPHSTATDPQARLEAEIAAIAGSASAKTGIWALAESQAHTGLYPALVIAPGYTSQRLGNVANPVATSIDALCTRLIDCFGIVDTPSTSREAAALYAKDFAASLNMIAMYPGVMVSLGGQNVARPLSPHVAAAIVRRDKEVGNPFKAAWNRPLKGILGPTIPVSYTDGDTSSEANFLNQAGVGTVIEGKLLWAPFTTATDPTTKGWRSIKRIRTRRSVEKAMLRPMRKYISDDITPHMVTLMFQSLDQYCGDLKTLGAFVDHEVLWSPSMNPASVLEAGAMRVRLRFAETPDLNDLQIYTEPQPEAFDVLASSIAAAINALGRPNMRVTA